MDHSLEGHFLQRQLTKNSARSAIVAQPKISQTTRKKRTPKRKSLVSQTMVMQTFTTMAFPPPFPAAEPETLRSAAPDFPAFDYAIHPVDRVPNWGAMRTPQAWNRSYAEMTDTDFVPVPAYDLSTLTIPLSSLLNPITPRDIPVITAKLYYSTRYYGSYDLDAGEFTGAHPGVDLKLAPGTPVGAIGGGRVTAVRQTERGLGLHVLVEHRLRSGLTLYSVYGHLESVSVAVGDDVRPGQNIGAIGMTGSTTAPHLHLQIDMGAPGEDHQPYAPKTTPSPDEDATRTVNPMLFIERYAQGE